MFNFQVPDMVASDQAVAIVKAIRHVDDNATVHIDVAKHAVRIAPAAADATQLSDAISDAGFHPTLDSNRRAGLHAGQAPARIPFEGPAHDFSGG